MLLLLLLTGCSYHWVPTAPDGCPAGTHDFAATCLPCPEGTEFRAWMLSDGPDAAELTCRDGQDRRQGPAAVVFKGGPGWTISKESDVFRGSYRDDLREGPWRTIVGSIPGLVLFREGLPDGPFQMVVTEQELGEIGATWLTGQWRLGRPFGRWRVVRRFTGYPARRACETGGEVQSRYYEATWVNVECGEKGADGKRPPVDLYGWGARCLDPHTRSEVWMTSDRELAEVWPCPSEAGPDGPVKVAVDGRLLARGERRGGSPWGVWEFWDQTGKLRAHAEYDPMPTGEWWADRVWSPRNAAELAVQDAPQNRKDYYQDSTVHRQAQALYTREPQEGPPWFEADPAEPGSYSFWRIEKMPDDDRNVLKQERQYGIKRNPADVKAVKGYPDVAPVGGWMPIGGNYGWFLGR